MNSGTKHWTDEALLARVYGVDPPPGIQLEHLAECPECAARLGRLQTSRVAVLASAAAAPCSDERLRNQRTGFWRRVEQPATARLWRAVPAAATCCVLLLAVALNGPAPKPAGAEIASAVSDEQLFADIANVVNTDSPRAVDNIRGLFNEASTLEAQ